MRRLHLFMNSARSSVFIQHFKLWKLNLLSVTSVPRGLSINVVRQHWHTIIGQLQVMSEEKPCTI